VNIDLLQDMAAMRFDGGEADIQQVYDFLVGAAFGDHLQNLALAIREESGGGTHEVRLTVLPPNPAISGLPVRVNLGDVVPPLRLEGSGLDRVESVSSEAGEIQGAGGASGWAGSIRLKPGAQVGEVFAISLEVKGLEARLTAPEAIKVFGPRPSITGVKKPVPTTLGLSLRLDELPAETSVGPALTFRSSHDASFNTGEIRPVVELGCKSGGWRKTLSLSPDDHGPGATLAVAAPTMLFLSVDPGMAGYPGRLLTAKADVEPEGRSDAVIIGRVVRIPRLERFTLTTEQLGPSTYAGILEGRDLEVIEKTGWDPHNGLRVDCVPTPAPGDASLRPSGSLCPGPRPLLMPRYTCGSGERKRDERPRSPTRRPMRAWRVALSGGERAPATYPQGVTGSGAKS
jgi:hypothetical protein